jgi:hypothetical protein
MLHVCNRVWCKYKPVRVTCAVCKYPHFYLYTGVCTISTTATHASFIDPHTSSRGATTMATAVVFVNTRFSIFRKPYMGLNLTVWKIALFLIGQ